MATEIFVTAINCIDERPPSPLNCYVRLKLLTGLRMSDMLSLRRSDIKEDGIHVTPRKTLASSGKKIVITWDDAGELHQVLSDIQSIRPMASVYLCLAKC